MAIVPIFIHIREKSDKELREEMERDARWNEMMRKEEEAEIHRRQEEEWQRRLAKMEAERKAQEAWWQLENDDEWETRLLPEGWSPFGQTNFAVIRERNKNDFTEEDL